MLSGGRRTVRGALLCSAKLCNPKSVVLHSPAGAAGQTWKYGVTPDRAQPKLLQGGRHMGRKCSCHLSISGLPGL